MTKREFLNAVIAIDNAELTEFANKELAQMDAANVKRAAKNTEKKNETLVAAKELLGYLGKEPKTASDVTALVGGEMKVQKVSALLRKAVEAGYCGVTDVKVKGKGVQKAYFIA